MNKLMIYSYFCVIYISINLSLSLYIYIRERVKKGEKKRDCVYVLNK